MNTKSNWNAAIFWGACTFFTQVLAETCHVTSSQHAFHRNPLQFMCQQVNTYLSSLLGEVLVISPIQDSFHQFIAFCKKNSCKMKHFCHNNHKKTRKPGGTECFLFLNMTYTNTVCDFSDFNHNKMLSYLNGLWRIATD